MLLLACVVSLCSVANSVSRIDGALRPAVDVPQSGQADSQSALLAAMGAEKSPFLRAVASGDVAAVKSRLVEVPNALAERCDIFEHAKELSPLHLAVMFERREVMLTLLDKAEAPLPFDSRGWTPLHHAVSRGDLASVRVLLESGKSRVDERTADFTSWETPLMMALWRDHGEIAEHLLQRGASPCALNRFGDRPLQLWRPRRAESGRLLRVLWDATPPACRESLHGSTIVHLAAKQWPPELLREAVAIAGLCQRLTTSEGTPLHELCSDIRSKGDCDRVRVLLELGADVMVRDQKGCTPLHRVAAGGGEGRGQLVRDLVKAGAIVDVIDSANRTPLQLALLSMSSEVIDALMEVGADPDYGVSETVATPRVLAGTLLADPKFKGIRDDQRRALQAAVTAAPREQPKDRP